MIQFLKELFSRDRMFGATRSSQWDKMREEHIDKFPWCEICDKKGLFRSNEVHHIKPFHLFPNEELNPDNLITLCRIHHLEWGHFFSFKSYNLDIRKDVERIANRP